MIEKLSSIVLCTVCCCCREICSIAGASLHGCYAAVFFLLSWNNNDVFVDRLLTLVVVLCCCSLFFVPLFIPTYMIHKHIYIYIYWKRFFHRSVPPTRQWMNEWMKSLLCIFHRHTCNGFVLLFNITTNVEWIELD